MKICIVSEFFIPHYQGGGERRYYEIAKALIREGHTVDVISMKIHDKNEEEIFDGIKVHHIGPTIKKPPLRSVTDFIRFSFAVFRWILSHDYDIIDAQTYAPLIPSFLGAKIKNIPMVATIHDVSTRGDDQWIQSSKIATITEKILLRIPYQKIITVSHSTKNALIQFWGVKEDRIQVVYNGVDLKLIEEVKIQEKYENTIIFVGRLAPHKHVDHLLKILKSIKSQINNPKLLIVGDGVERENLINLTQKYGLQNQVEFRGNLNYPELISELKKSNILALPSTREGFGMVLIEANACGIPVVAYASGGVMEVVKDGFNGFLVETQDIETFKEKIKFLLKNHSEATIMGENGKRMVEKNFTWDITVKKIINAYQDA